MSPTVTCPRCGTDNPAGFRFCGNCAASLGAPAADAGERRKVVTVLFCDVADSTSLGEARDPEQMRAVMARYFDTARAALERHGGTVEKFIGDAVMAVFGHPVLHEDDALRAVRAAAELRADLGVLNEQLRKTWGVTIETRIGVNTGPVVAGEGGSAETLVTGDAVNVAARLQTAAEPGEILIGAETQRLVRDAVRVEELAPLSLKGKELPVAAWRLLAVDAEAAGHARHLDSALVGRERESRLLEQAFEESVADQACVLFTLLGPAGVGKSRLVHEFLAGVAGRARVLRGRCLPYGEGITYWPLAEVVKAAAAIADDDSAATARAKLERLLPGDEHASAIAADVAAAIGLAEREGAGEEIFWAARRFLELLAAERPLIVVFDDVHWAESTFLDLVEHVSDWSRDAPIMLLCVARPELLESRPTWAGGKLHSTTLMLQPLAADQVAQLVQNLLGQGDLAEAIARRVGDAAEGNPLFVEEFVAMLIDDGRMRRDGDRWAAVGDLDTVAVPPSIRALLAARIDQLDRRERSVIERASVVGKVFWQGAVAELAPEPLRPDVHQSLLRLVRKELVRPDRSDFKGDEAYRFRHLLVRDAAYEGLPKQDRGELHERFATWLERTAGERVAEYEEVLGYHLEQAYLYRAELGAVDDRAVGLGLRAARMLGSAGLRASDRGDVAAAAKLLDRALRLYPPDHPDRAHLLFELAEVTGEAGDIESALRLFEEAATAGELSGQQGIAWRARLMRSAWGVNANPEGAADEALVTLEQAIPALESLDDQLGLAQAWELVHGIRYYRGDLPGARLAGQQMLEHARRAGSERLEISALVIVASLAVWDETPLEQGIAEAEDALARARAAGRRLPEAQALGIKGRLLGMIGRHAEARQLAEEALAILRDLGRVLHVAGGTQWLGTIAFNAREPAVAEAALRRSVEGLEALGEKAMLSSSLGDLALAVAMQGRQEEADMLSRRAEDMAAADDVAAQMSWRVARLLAVVERGERDDTVRLAGEMLQMADEAAYPVVRAFTIVVLAAALAELVGPAVARQRLEEARAYYVAKGAPAMVEWVDEQLTVLPSQSADESANRPQGA